MALIDVSPRFASAVCETECDLLVLSRTRFFDLLPKQNMDRTPLTRHFSLYTVEPGSDAETAQVISALQVYRTETDGGVTSLVAVGKYRDKVALNGGAPKLLEREVRLDTRMLGAGYHVPF